MTNDYERSECEVAWEARKDLICKNLLVCTLELFVSKVRGIRLRLVREEEKYRQLTIAREGSL